MATHTHNPTDDPPQSTTDALVPVDPPDLAADPEAVPSEPIVPRQCLEIRPSERPLDSHGVRQAMDQLFALLKDFTRTGFLTKLRGKTRYPVVEWLLVSDGRPDPTLRYLVSSNYLEIVEDLEGILRTCFPNSYEFRFVEFHPTFTHEHLPISDADFDHPAITPEHPYVAGVEFRGRTTLRRDWQTPLQPSPLTTTDPHRTRHRTPPRNPLSTVLEAIVQARLPVHYQVIISPEPDWSDRAEVYVRALEEGRVGGVGDKLIDAVFGRTQEQLDRYTPGPADQNRIDGIRSRDPARTVSVAARAAVLTRDQPKRADDIARRLTGGLGHLNGSTHEIVGRVSTDDDWYDGIGPPPGSKIFEDICSMTAPYATYEYPLNRLPWWNRDSRGIVVDLMELPGFCLVDGAGLTQTGRRALAARGDRPYET